MCAIARCAGAGRAGRSLRCIARVCGTSLFYHLIESDEYILSVGAMDEQGGFVLDSEIFVDEQPPFYTFANDTKKMTGAGVIAFVSEEDNPA